MSMLYRVLLIFALLVGTAPAGAQVTWTECANEGGTCVFSGTRRVRYGAIDSQAPEYRTKSISQSASCSNATFGDPAKNRAKKCWYSSVSTQVGGGSSTAGQAPNYGQYTTLVNSGRIVAVSGQVIENVRVTTKSGSCIEVPPGVTNVTIRNSELGPCGTDFPSSIRQEGVWIRNGASNVTIQGNLIHDVSTALLAEDAVHPIVFDRNRVWNIRGPLWQGQMVQFSRVRNGSGSSKVTCNVKDGLDPYAMAVGSQQNEDHISMYNSLGISNAQPIEIAYNRIRGNRNGSSESGSGITVGDGENGQNTSESGFFHIHHNTIVLTNGSGIQVAGGHDTRVENNKVFQKGTSKADNTNWSFAARNYSTNWACHNVQFNNNQSVPARLWAYWDGFFLDGSQAWGTGIYDGGGCTFTQSGNDFNNSTLNAIDPATNAETLFQTAYTECDSGSAPVYSLTQIYALAETPPSTPKGKDVILKLRVYGRPMPDYLKPTVHLLNSDGSDTGFEMKNHHYLLPGSSWNGYLQFDYLINVGVEVPTGTYRIGLNYYQGVSPYTNYMGLTQCNGVTLRNGTHCDVGSITVSAQNGAPSTVVTTDPQGPTYLSGTTWTP